MRKVSFLLIVAALLVANAGCGGKIRSWFNRGSPCGTTTVAPAVLGAPLAMGVPAGGPAFAMPAQVPTYGGDYNCCPQSPICVDPCQQSCPQYECCDPCCEDNCVGGWQAGYDGTTLDSGDYSELPVRSPDSGSVRSSGEQIDPRPAGDE